MLMIPSLIGSHLEHMVKTTTKLKLLTYELAEQYALITLQNGKANVFSHELISDINEALDMVEKEKKTVIFTGHDGMFSGGFDLSVMMKSEKDARALVKKGTELCYRLLSFPYPVIMACSGHAIAQGAFMLLSADYRIGAKGHFRIGLNEVLIGLTMHYGGIALGRFKLTPRYLDRSMNNAELYTPDSAVEAGFLDETTPPNMLLPTAIKMARMMAKFNMKAHHETKLRLRKELLDALVQAIEKDS
ncbi:crotonase/enoyl-CoA hydratase family protein [Aquiflexum lacus]|uniref:crotonase/enoyl-CoA hydratase family protein n=1 Tax=Aquiflexum lacus TaxID=2483805 RepID=UPI003743934B